MTVAIDVLGPLRLRSATRAPWAAGASGVLWRCSPRRRGGRSAPTGWSTSSGATSRPPRRRARSRSRSPGSAGPRRTRRGAPRPRGLRPRGRRGRRRHRSRAHRAAGRPGPGGGARRDGGGSACGGASRTPASGTRHAGRRGGAARGGPAAPGGEPGQALLDLGRPEEAHAPARTPRRGPPVPRAAVVAAGARALPLRPAGRRAGDAAHPAHRPGRGAGGGPVRLGPHARGGPAGPGAAPRRASRREAHADAPEPGCPAVVGRAAALADIDAALTDWSTRSAAGCCCSPARPASARPGWPPRSPTAPSAAGPGQRGPVPRGRPGAAVLAVAAGAARPGADRDALPAEVDLLEGGTPARARPTRAPPRTTLRTFDAVTRLLGRVARPLVVVLEDMHWSDHTSLRLLAYAAEALRDRPVLFVATVRDVDPRSHPALTQALAALARLGARRVPVRPSARRRSPSWSPTCWTSPTRPSSTCSPAAPTATPSSCWRWPGCSPRPGGRRPRRPDLEVPDGIADVVRLRVLQLGRARPRGAGGGLGGGPDFDARTLTAALGGTCSTRSTRRSARRRRGAGEAGRSGSCTR